MMHMPPEHPTTHPSPITKSLSLSQIVRFETKPPVLHQTRQTKTESFIAKSWFSSLLSKLCLLVNTMRGNASKCAISLLVTWLLFLEQRPFTGFTHLRHLEKVFTAKLSNFGGGDEGHCGYVGYIYIYGCIYIYMDVYIYISIIYHWFWRL